MRRDRHAIATQIANAIASSAVYASGGQSGTTPLMTRKMSPEPRGNIGSNTGALIPASHAGASCTMNGRFTTAKMAAASAALRRATLHPWRVAMAIKKNGPKNQAICFVAQATPNARPLHRRSRHSHAATSGSA